MSDPQALVEALLKKSILGQELVDTKFHLFSSRSARAHKVTRPQALSANDIVLIARSEFFAKVLTKTAGELDATIVDLPRGSEDNHCLGQLEFDEYGYASDSDLDDDEEKEEQEKGDHQILPSGGAVASEANRRVRAYLRGLRLKHDDDEDHDDEVFVEADGRSEIDLTVGDPIARGSMPIVTTSAPIQHKARVVDCRNILVRDAAFRTWKALLLHLYTDKIVFSPLKSQGQAKVDIAAPNASALWPCSPKSMYRLACKVGLVKLRDQAFSAIRSSLNAGNILREISSSYTSKYPAILEMQVDVLLQHIASVDVIQNVPSLLKRIAGSQLPHGADIIINLYQKVLLQYHPQAFKNAQIREPPPAKSSPPLASPSLPAELAQSLANQLIMGLPLAESSSQYRPGTKTKLKKKK